jgi:hypothetical protein
MSLQGTSPHRPPTRALPWIRWGPRAAPRSLAVNFAPTLIYMSNYDHYPNATFQPSIIDCKLNSHHENKKKNVHSWNTAYLTLQK